MTRPELLLHLNRLETAMQKRYTEGFKLVAFDYLAARPAEDLRFSVDRIIETEKTLPALSVILANLPQETKPTHGGPGTDYWNHLNMTHELAERIVGDSFDNFVRCCNGNNALASLHFGRAYWNAKGITKYNDAYDELIRVCDKEDANNLLPPNLKPAEAR